MTSEEIKVQIKELIRERLFLHMEPEQVKDDASLLEELGIDSIGLFELIVALEEEFGIKVEDTEFDLEQFLTIERIAYFTESKLANKGSA